MDRPLVFFDSGLGGVTVLKEALKAFPKEDIFYLGDTAHVPYGSKNPNTILGLVRDAIEMTLPLDPKAIVLACNTATSVAAPALREALPLPIIGMEPAIKPALEAERGSGKRVLLLATEATCQGEKLRVLRERVDPDGRLDVLPLPGLVQMAEDLDFSKESLAALLEEVNRTSPLKDYSGLVLGCTHFIYYRDLLKDLLPKVNIYDGNAGTLRQVQRKIQGQEGRGPGGVHIYFSAPLTRAREDFLRSYLDVPFDLICPH